MLARAARRRLRRDALQRPAVVYEQLTLPWLYPAHTRWTSSRSIPGGQSPESRKQTLPQLISPRRATRSLTTAIDALPQMDDMPFEGLKMMQSWQSRTTPAMTTLPYIDPSRPLIIHHSLATAPPKTKFRNGIGGDPKELHQNLYACLRVGRMDRAAAIVQRLTELYDPSALEVVDAHNRYLQTLLENVPEESSSASMHELEAWFNKEMVAKGVDPDAQTLVILIRASLAFLDGPSMEENVQKYLELARDIDPALHEEVNSSDEFTDSEWDTLIRLQSDVFDEPSSLSPATQVDVSLSTPAGHAIAIEQGLLEDPSLRVKSVPQKGSGLKHLREALASLEPGKAVPYPHELEGSQEEKDKRHAYLRQIQLEENAYQSAIERWRADDAKLKEMGIHSVLQTKSMGALMWQWYSAMLPLVQKELKEIKAVLADPTLVHSSDERVIYGPYMESVSAEKLTAVTIQTCLHLITNDTRKESTLQGGAKISVLAISIGNVLETELAAVQSSKNHRTAQSRRSMRRNLLAKLIRGGYKAPAKKSKTESPSQDGTVTWFDGVPLHVKTRIGANLIDKMMRSAKIKVTREDPTTGETVTSSQHAWARSTGFNQGKRIGYLQPHYELATMLTMEPISTCDPFKLPMLVEPKPWSEFKDGGYFIGTPPAIRFGFADDSQRAYALSAIKKGDMEQVFAGMDVLGRTPWKINKDVYRVIIEAWNKGEGVGGLVPANVERETPPEPPSGADWRERMNWQKKVQEIANEISGFHSQRCFQNLQLEVARAYLNDTLYYPHNLDFRGRAYPIPPTLNHMGADLARSLLKFAKGKELGVVGLQWLKVHLANLYGFDKASLKEREEFAMEHIHDVYDSASNPLTGNRWWAKAEDPWQCLGCCIELKNALDSPDPTRYVSYMPVHQDGTCNGLQHYAALGGDRAGATQVNLEPSDRPQDIYTGVAEIVKSDITADAKLGNKAALFLDGKITRKVVKRTVMTNVYGVTFMGAKDQVLDELKAVFPHFEPVDGVSDLGYVARYVVRKIFKALGQIFNGAQDIQFWLGECADRITSSITAEQIQRYQDHVEGKLQIYDGKYKPSKTKKSGRSNAKLVDEILKFKTGVIWTTPLKMPVVQPYRVSKSVAVRTSVQAISITQPTPQDTVSKRKQLQAFPPNFIHSLDATHMTLSALKCDEMGLQFAAVHDSFWTHASDVPMLNSILRDAFIRMHCEDIIGRLAAEFKARYAGSLYRATLLSSSPAAQEITQWRRLRRGKGEDEILLEAKRQRLLRSEDPEERRQGEEMVTPASIYANSQDPLAVVSESGSALLGNIEGGKTRKEVQRKVLAAELGSKETTEDVEAPSNGAEMEAETEGFVDANMDAHEVLDDEAKLDPTAETERSLQEMDSKTEATPRKSARKTNIWLPLTFPPVPQKGDFDVTRLKESKYFFS